MNYEELVEALRLCGKDLMHGERCKDSCPYGDIALCIPKLKLDAAAAIEELQAQLPKRGEIVRCKECLHYNAGFECLVEGYGIERDPDWFCADGERRAQDGQD